MGRYQYRRLLAVLGFSGRAERSADGVGTRCIFEATDGRWCKAICRDAGGVDEEFRDVQVARKGWVSKHRYRGLDLLSDRIVFTEPVGGMDVGNRMRYGAAGLCFDVRKSVEGCKQQGGPERDHHLFRLYVCPNCWRLAFLRVLLQPTVLYLNLRVINRPGRLDDIDTATHGRRRRW
jgi:hypothetical protein